MRRAAAAIALLVVAVAAGAALRGALSGGGAHAPRVPGRLSALPSAPVSTDTRFSPDAVRNDTGRNLIATARSRQVIVRSRPSKHARGHALNARRFDGRRLPLVFLVKRRQGGWLEVHLPTRPNRATGWLRAGAVRLTQTRYRLQVQLRTHRLVLWRGRRTVVRAAIGTGRAVSPTPTGRYYVTDLIRPRDPGGFFGPYALGLSAHSPVYTSFEGGDGQIGIHGTNEPAALGRDVSHGCIRVRNAIIRRIAGVVPLGTPVDITRV
jgi:lipoprotein-anchoring transpeptidase ErfK/SrfK